MTKGMNRTNVPFCIFLSVCYACSIVS